MLYWLAELSDKVSVFNVFRYITFRAAGAIVTAALFVFLFGPIIIAKLRMKQGKGQPIRTDGPQSHLVTKKGTPTMGGLMILSGLVMSTVLWANPTNPYVWVVLFVTLGFGLIGFYDDYLKVTKQSHAGFPGKMRLALECLIALVACIALANIGRPPFATALALPFIKGVAIDLGWFFVAFGTFIIVGAGNAVNLTDGLDGLAIVPVMIASASFAAISWVVGNFVFAEYLQLNYVAGAGELTVLCAAILGAGLGFLWFNCHPAEVFMGDTGSLALGGALGIMAVLIHQPLVLVIAGGVFVAEALSVLLQVSWFKFTRRTYGAGRRIFLMSPLHHHFRKKGWPESKIVTRFYIVAVLCAVVALSSLKVR